MAFTAELKRGMYVLFPLPLCSLTQYTLRLKAQLTLSRLELCGSDGEQLAFGERVNVAFRVYGQS